MVTPAIEKGMAVLRLLADADQPLSFGQLAARAVMARSSLHDVCSSLVATGLVEKTPQGQYTIGLSVVELARRRLSSMEIVSTFQAVCAAASPSPETIVLSVMSGSDVIYVSFIHGTRPLAVRYEIGMRLPAAFTASGKAMLATLPDKRVRELVGASVNNPLAGGNHKTVAVLLRELEDTRRRRYSIDDEETARGMTCIGAPVFAGDDPHAAGAVAISLVKSAADWFDTGTRDRVCEIAAEVSRLLGATAGWWTAGFAER
jgi:DNA-binding IclR family transcriptional regulator